MANEIRIRRTYEPRDERSYVRLPFDVPESTDRIEVSYDYERYAHEVRPEGVRRVEANVIDLGLLDERGGFRGWSGAERGSASLSATDATPGYLPGPVNPGSWAVALGLYRIGATLDVTVTIRIHLKRPTLLVGDFHVHTVNSDGAYRTGEVVDLCRRAGLDFVALTDHNTVRQNDEICAVEGITAIAGMEYTNYRGHANLYFPGARHRFEHDPLSGSFEEMRATLQAARDMGAVISLNHPHCEGSPWTFGFDGLPYDLVEVWNGALGPLDVRALVWWHEQLCLGRRIPLVGGSDFHRHEMFRTLGSPATFVHASSRSAADILAAAVAGRSFLSSSRAGPQVDLRVGARGLGETAEVGEGTQGVATVRGAQAGDVVRLLDGRGGATEWQVPFEGEHTRSFGPEPDVGFYRLEVWRDHPPGVRLLGAVSSPVFIGPRVSG